jgi:predicted branched-subunit amino acid permease
MTFAGIWLGDRVPGQWGLGFAGVLVLLGLIGSMLTDRATWAAAIVAAVTAVATYDLPLKLNIVAAIAAAVAVGLLVDRHSLRVSVTADDRT